MKYIILLFSFFFFTNCYVYKTGEYEEGKQPQTVKEEVRKNHFYKVNVSGKEMMIKAEKWEKDSLVAYVNGNKKKEIKLHSNQISQVKIRTFSRGRSDALTFGSYGLAGVLLYLIFK